MFAKGKSPNKIIKTSSDCKNNIEKENITKAITDKYGVTTTPSAMLTSILNHIKVVLWLNDLFLVIAFSLLLQK